MVYAGVGSTPRYRTNHSYTSDGASANTATELRTDMTTITWPFSEGSMLIDKELARNITAWALTCMSPAELRSYSQRQLMGMYLESCLKRAIERGKLAVCPDTASQHQ